MFERIANGWSLTKHSWEVLKLDKELLVFPLISGIACTLVLASFAIPLYNTPYVQTVMNEGGQMPQGPITAVKRSFAVLRKTWGESLAANFGIGIITFLGMGLSIIPIVIGAFAISNGLGGHT